MVETRSGKMQDPAQERIKDEESAKPQPGKSGNQNSDTIRRFENIANHLVRLELGKANRCCRFVPHDASSGEPPSGCVCKKLKKPDKINLSELPFVTEDSHVIKALRPEVIQLDKEGVARQSLPKVNPDPSNSESKEKKRRISPA
ncbi:hypothetical protein LAZ67_X003448 [Cordylochernes scorpioides]|uniref:Uncharacterized protein n=1 Tax=Cordylochernes scorpioides TaxID=51811 RepID=A0ABY6LV61_9ARAC|nr:hypothetical protein LAZ67_X003448 [Cordylochernes scorpioides]